MTETTTYPKAAWNATDHPYRTGIVPAQLIVEAAGRAPDAPAVLTAEGTVRSCLFGDDETDLRALLRGGASDAEIAERWQGAMWNKQAGHGINADDFVRPERSMGAIGG